MKGGKVIASGTYGCVFDPALICKGETKRTSGYVTKLLGKEDFDEEMKEISAILPYISQIPNNKNYFVLTQNRACRPRTKKIKREDMEDYERKCGALMSKGITPGILANEIRNERVMGIQMVNAGMDLSRYIKTFGNDKAKMVVILESLKDLIANGIRPMNNLNVIHNDVKAANMAFDGRHIRLIDWGLSSNPSLKLGIYSESDMPLMFNCPLTILLFYKDDAGFIIKRRFDRFIKNNGSKKDTISQFMTRLKPTHNKIDHLTGYVNKYFTSTIFENEEKIVDFFNTQHVGGHFGHICKDYFNSKRKELLTFLQGITAYVLVNFSFDSTTNTFKPFDIERFYSKVYRYNNDIYGALTILRYITEKNGGNTPLLREIESAQDILLFSGKSQVEPYNIDEVSSKLDKIISVLKPSPVSTPAAPVLHLSDNKGKREIALGGKKRTKRYRIEGGKKKKNTRKRK